MTARTITKEYGHFLVKWGGQGKKIEYHVVPRSKVLAEGRIRVGDVHNTIWGDTSTEAAYAEILNTGEWLEMRKDLKNYTEKPSDTPPVLTSPESPTSSYHSPDVPPPPARKRKRKTPTKPKKPTKPDANVICWVEGITQSPQAADPYEFKSATPSPELPFDLQPPTPPSTHLSPPSTTEPTQTTEKNQLPGNQMLAMITELKTQVQVLNNRSLSQELAMSQLIKQNERLITLVQDLTNRPTTFAPHRPWAPTVSDTPTRFQPATARQLHFNTPSAAVPTTPLPNIATSTRVPTPRIIPSSSMFEVIDAKFQSIPAPHKIAATDLLREFNSSSGPGNFAKHIVELLYPELFTCECLRRFYSYNGDAKNNKNPLDTVRLQYLHQYVSHFFPEVTQQQAWKLMVVTKINEALRRPIPGKQKKKTL